MAFSALVSASSADATTTISFTGFPNGAHVTTIGDATFSLIGGPDSSGSPTTGPFGVYGMLGNSNSEGYPTSAILDVTFSSPVKNISFTFNNFGGNGYHDGGSFAATYGAGHALEGLTSVAYAGGGLYSVAGSHVVDLQFNNSEGTSRSWLFGVGEITFDSAVPEPSTWAMLLSGFGFIGYVLRRRVLRTA
jgi:hypothetical protein